MKKILLKSLSIIMVMGLFVGVIAGCSCSKDKNGNNKDNTSENLAESTVLGNYKFSNVEIEGQTHDSCAESDLDPGAKMMCETYESFSFDIKNDEIVLISIGGEKVPGFYKIEEGKLFFRKSTVEEWEDEKLFVENGQIRWEISDYFNLVFVK